MNLYELTSKYNDLIEMMNDPDVDEDILLDTFDAVDGSFEEKADGYAKIIKGCESDARQIDEEIKRLQDRKTALTNRAARFKSRLQESMLSTGKTKFRTPIFSFGIQKNPPSVKLRSDDWHEIPKKYLIDRDPTIDKKGILEALKAGEELGFAWIEQGESLRIR